MKHFGLVLAGALLFGGATIAQAQTAPNENQAPTAATADQGQSNTMAGQPPGQETGGGNASAGISNTPAPGTANQVATTTPHRGNHRHRYKRHYRHYHHLAMVTTKKHAKASSATRTRAAANAAPGNTPAPSGNDNRDTSSPDAANPTQPR